ncbi:MAG: glycine--tRNA ligase subunit alpha [Enterobacterales bacterium]
MNNTNFKTFQELIKVLKNYWSNIGCISIQPLDLEVGAGTSHPMTCLRSIGPEPMFCVYVQPSRRPSDGRYGKNSNRLQHYYQLQVIMKPVPNNFQDLYLYSLKEIGIDCVKNDIRFIADDWSNPTLGAFGMGWEVQINGMEITQITYFQQVCGMECNPITGEITYGLERLSMHIQKVKTVYDIIWDNRFDRTITYGDLFFQNEVEQSIYNFEYSNINFLLFCFEQNIKDIHHLLNLKKPLSLPAYELILKTSHIFNLLDARKAISVTERQNYIIKLNNLSKEIAKSYFNSRKDLNFPMCNKITNKEII